MQTQQAARRLPAERDEANGPAHLLLAVIDQADPEAIDLLNCFSPDRSSSVVG